MNTQPVLKLTNKNAKGYKIIDKVLREKDQEAISLFHFILDKRFFCGYPTDCWLTFHQYGANITDALLKN